MAVARTEKNQMKCMDGFGTQKLIPEKLSSKSSFAEAIHIRWPYIQFWSTGSGRATMVTFFFFFLTMLRKGRFCACLSLPINLQNFHIELEFNTLISLFYKKGRGGDKLKTSGKPHLTRRKQRTHLMSVILLRSAITEECEKVIHKGITLLSVINR